MLFVFCFDHQNCRLNIKKKVHRVSELRFKMMEYIIETNVSLSKILKKFQLMNK